ncbi:MAG: hypothetical protein COW19_00125 [Zetaproteobacteria bacterium CG12_big_fil_rev_8_21_14_0_65_55_1124]|nr:MAG: hypothetical protein AUJ58_02940 [Zetaproteobacteria bacterium CG1_02_55_237]PIS18721.1 MAG: hypothetical protein COT53_09255 [Zetaproteobacteria bacterium CG08_land_8_20_14_0_20_55_17]PIW43953.1 MAG: hypothetical protein COW19_00125 [Zetaproteobacteria bacterium CG12_big_fil_rev_8_21_14_0_65_55_1124]PIY52448.1 MAG: hypothetical protein COZ01_07570 [Zetaproteobacteria bacterium CG_4_10_14_0_8_um_filter_55_43]PIZ36727.1 MAG: hypothetical protein COY36_11240 [Zetaproteobacteria bacterium 
MNATLLQKATACHQKGELQQAAEIYQQLLEMDSEHADANHLLGLIAHQSGKHELAVQLILKAINKNPSQPMYYDNLAIVLRTMGKLEDAANCYQQVVRIQPEHATAYQNLGNIRLQQGKLPAAVAAYQLAIRIAPDNACALNNLGVAWLKQGNLIEAEKSFREAMRAKSDYAEACSNLGLALKNQGKLEEAETALKQALTMNPDDAGSHYNLGNVFMSLGKLKEARETYSQALQIRPDYTEAFRSLSNLKRYSDIDDETLRMEALYNSPDISHEKQMHLGFALGKIYEDVGVHEKAFAYLMQANRLFRSGYNYDLAEDKAFFDLVTTIFDQDFMQQHQDCGNRDQTPIFIVGMPRSGTSLVEQILASHPQVYGAGELLYLKQAILRACGNAPGYNFLKNIETFRQDDFQHLGSAYIEKLRSHSTGATHITDKLPHNFFYLGMIKIILPRARIIHCQREPLDNCLSIYKNYFSDSQRYAYQLDELGEYYHFYQALMEHWHHTLPADSIYDIQYEALVADQETQTKALLKHCALPWDEQCLSFHKTNREVKTASAAQVRQPVHQRSVHLWKRYEKHLQPLIKSLAGSGN